MKTKSQSSLFVSLCDKLHNGTCIVNDETVIVVNKMKPMEHRLKTLATSFLEYNLDDICIGVPCIIGSNGVESIVDIKLNEKEKKQMIESANKVSAMNTTLKGIL